MGTNREGAKSELIEYEPYITELNPVEAVMLLNELPPVGSRGVHASMQLWPDDRQSAQLELIDNRDDYIAMAILECYPLGPLFGSRLKLETHDRDSYLPAMEWFEAAKRALPAAAAEQEPEPWWRNEVKDLKHRRFIRLWRATKGDVLAIAESLDMKEYRVRRTSSSLRKVYGKEVVPLKKDF
jgi:hypothetical protein